MAFKYLFNLIFIVCSMINMFHNRKFIIKKFAIFLKPKHQADFSKSMEYQQLLKYYRRVFNSMKNF